MAIRTDGAGNITSDGGANARAEGDLRRYRVETEHPVDVYIAGVKTALFPGQFYELTDAEADPVIAALKQVDGPPRTKAQSPAADKSPAAETEDLSELGVTALRARARAASVPRYSRMNRDELIAALS